eukprot:CAMPEP_0114684836 /NCGR_PEP_ID=MMETSP0191-20121206/59656_1 /TAXON_ID=126664 /ORGANISM="Sorites sp." /LENGTH=84 /DNA_ID=CAMNT_0001968277 /DNA_START=557 /DNA_END=811 /DNA_ORIENTATION=+
MPMESPCGASVTHFQTKEVAKVMEFHQDLVRCMVPPENFLEINIFDQPDTEKITKFLVGKKVRIQMPYAHLKDLMAKMIAEDDE